MALEFRRDGLDYIAERIRTALGDEGDAANEAITEIAGQMQTFLASDVLYRAHRPPLITHALKDAKIGGQKIAASRFLPGIEWLSEQTVATELGQTLSSGGGGANARRRRRACTAPGSRASRSATPRCSPTRPTASRAGADTPIVVKFANQGENDEFDVKVTVTVEGGDKPIKASRTVDTVAKGQTAEASLTLGKAPPVGRRGHRQGRRSRRCPARRRPTTTTPSTTSSSRGLGPASPGRARHRLRLAYPRSP